MKVTALVVGGGQAGLSTAFELRRRGVECVVLEAGNATGESWRNRWESLRLFTPNRFNQLPGVGFPGAPGDYPTKDEMAGYLAGYPEAAGLDVRTGVRVTSVRRTGEAYRVESTDGAYTADHVVVATGFSRPRLPAFADRLAPEVLQLDASTYRGAHQFRGRVLVVGTATSGVEIAIDAARAGHATTLAGRDVPRVPPFAYLFGGRPFMFMARHVMTTRTPMGRRMRPRVLSQGSPLIRVSMREALDAGVQRASRIVGVEEGVAVDAGGRRLPADTVVWCTGWEHDFSWIDAGLADDHGLPRQRDGAVEGQPGLYFVGLPFQTCMASHFVAGAPRDAARVAAIIAGRLGASASTAAVRA